MSLREYPLQLGRWSSLLFPILVGGLVLAIVVANRSVPQRVEIGEVPRPLVVVSTPRTDVIPRVLGYGTARPGDVWTAVADVSGRIVETHAELEAGAIIRQGEMVVQIDPSGYELRLSQLEAEIAQIVAQQEELTAQEANYQAALAIEEEALRLAERDLERVRGLRTTGAVTESEYEEVSRNVLSQRQSVQSVKSSLNVIPWQQQALTASLQAKQAGAGQAQLDLDHTTIRAPLNCRLSDVALEVGQFVLAGQTLFESYGADVTEVEAQMPIDRVRTLVNREAEIDLSVDAASVVKSVFDVEAVVRLKTGDFEVEWPARFDRTREELDLRTRTLRVVVAVDKPYQNVIPGTRPPLAPGMFCEVELRGKPLPDQVVIPRTSVRDGAVYLVNEDSRLERRPVTLAFSQGAFSVVKEGLSGGELLVVSDPTPAIEGMLITPRDDPMVTTRLIAEADGGGPVR